MRKIGEQVKEFVPAMVGMAILIAVAWALVEKPSPAMPKPAERLGE